VSPLAIDWIAAGIGVARSLPGTRGRQLAPVKLTAQQDHQRLMDLLHITALRPGKDGNRADAPNAAITNESKANPYPHLPDPLVLKNGKKVKTASVWWSGAVRRSSRISTGRSMAASPSSRPK